MPAVRRGLTGVIIMKRVNMTLLVRQLSREDGLRVLMESLYGFQGVVRWSRTVDIS